MTDTPPDAPLVPARRSLLERASFVWIVPIVAVAVALFVAWQNYSDRGPVFQIAFDGATGIRAGETDLRYRDVSVGLVEAVGFSDDLGRVVATVRLKEARIAPYIDDSAKFWVVRPEVSARGVTGLNTVLSGVFIEGVWDIDPAGFQPMHTGLTEAPLLRAGESGLVIRLRAQDEATLTRGTSIFHKGIEVGRIGTPELLPGGAAAEAEAVIYEPYDALVTSATRFWDASGFSFRLGAGGAELDFTSVASLIAGGVTFDTVISGGVPAEDGDRFDLFSDADSARTSLFADNAGPVVNLSALFEDNVAGLTPGAPVTLGGVEVGEVANVTGAIDPERFGDARVRLLATLDLRPGRMGLETDGDVEADMLDFLEQRVNDGLRARLATASLLTGGLKVELVVVPGAAGTARFDRDAQPFPVIPATASEVTDVSATAQGVLQRINDLPIEELLGRATEFLGAATRLVGDEELGRVPAEVTALLGEIRGIVGADELQGLPARIGTLADDLSAVLTDLRTITGDPALQNVPADLAGLMADARGIVGSEAAQALPATLTDLAERISAVAGTAEGLISDPGTQALPGEAAALLADLRRVAASETLQALPVEIASLIDRLQDLTDDIARVAGDPALAALPGEVSGLVGDARTLVGGPDAAALPAAARAAVDRLSEVAQSLQAIAADPALAELPARANSILGDVAAITAAPEVQALPQTLTRLVDDLTGAAGALGGIAADLERTEAADRLVAALDAATVAAGSVTDSVAGIPELVADLNRVAEKAAEVPLDRLSADLSAALDAARAILDSDDARGLPASLRATLAEIEGALSDLRAGGTVENVNRTLAAAGDAAEAVERAARDLPSLAARLDRVLAQAGATLGDFDRDSELGRSLARVLREGEAAAEAVKSFARALERRPNSLIIGR